MRDWKGLVSQGFASAIQGLDFGVTRPLSSRLLGGLALAAMCVFFLPAHFFVNPDFGLEASWRLILNKAFSDGWPFGSRIIWTYGPCGFLESRYPFGISIFFYLIFDLFVLVVFLRWALDVL